MLLAPQTKKFSRLLAGFFTFVLLLQGQFFLAPKTVVAAEPVTVVEDVRAQIIAAVDIVEQKAQTIGISTTAVENAAQTYFGSWENFKENVLDPAMFYLANVAIERITQSIVQWINSGFQGSPAFVTDLEGFLLDIADEAAGEFIYNETGLQFLCSPFALDVRIALATQYAQSDDFNAQCSLSEISDNIDGFLAGAFTEGGGWPAWFELTQDVKNTPQGAYFQAQAALEIAITDAKGEKLFDLELGGGFLSFEACTEVKSADGNNKADCKKVTPGKVIQEATTEYLTIGTQRLVIADEIDEIVGALLSQLAKQALTGAAGLLGLGGNAEYSDNRFGSDGRLSYLQALNEPEPPIENTTVDARIDDALDVHGDYVDLQFEIFERIEAMRTTISTAAERDDLVEGCFAVSLSSRLANDQRDAEEAIRLAAPTGELLERLRSELALATTRDRQIELNQEVFELERDGLLVREVDLLVIDAFIQNELKVELEEMQEDVTDEIERCLIPPEDEEESDRNRSDR